MEQTTAKRIARVKLTLTKRTVDALEPEGKPWIAWDDKLTGFGCRVQPSGTKSFIVNYRAGDGGRKAPNKRVVVGRYGRVTADQARRCCSAGLLDADRHAKSLCSHKTERLNGGAELHTYRRGLRRMDTAFMIFPAQLDYTASAGVRGL